METITGGSFRAQTPAQMLGLPCPETVFVYIYSSVSLGCSSFSIDVLWFSSSLCFFLNSTMAAWACIQHQ